MNGELDRLIDFITKHYPFIEEKYPALKEVSEEERLRFAVRHLALHFSKTSGKIAAVSEPSDHGDPLNVDEIRTNLPKSLVNTLRLAQLVGMNEKELIEGVERMYGDSFK